MQLPCVNQDWMALVFGSLEQLRNPSTWAGLSDSALAAVLSQVDELRQLFATWSTCVNPVVDVTFANCLLTLHFADGTSRGVVDWAGTFDSCVKAHIPVQVPPNPDSVPTTQHACSIATFLSLQIEQQITKKLEAARVAGQDIATYINSILTDIGSIAPELGVWVGPAEAFFHTSETQTTSDLTDAVNSTALWQNVTCAIYSAIVGVGYVDSTNFATVQANIAAISFTHPWIVASLSLLWHDMGLPFWQEQQNLGSTWPGSCTGCSGPWCNIEDLTLGSGAWVVQPGGSGAYVLGTGWESVYLPVPNRSVLQLETGVGSAVTITSVQLRMSSPGVNTAGAAARQFAALHSGGVVWTAFLPAIAFAANSIITLTAPPALVADQYAFVWSSDGNNTAVFSEIQIRGNPPPPAGINPCP